MRERERALSVQIGSTLEKETLSEKYTTVLHF